jgi:cell division septal protein FtsQ
MTPTTTMARPRPAGGAHKRIDPRISARRSLVTRQQGRRRLRVLGVALGVVALLVGVWFLLHTSLFSARVVSVRGAAHETAAQVVVAAGLADHPPLIGLDAGAAAAGIERLPWVRTASVHAAWPDGVHIVIQEEVLALVMATGTGQWAELSASGRILTLSATRPPGLVLVAGPQHPGAAGTVLGAADQAGLRVATTLPPSFAAQVTGVTVEPGGWVQLAMTTPILVNIGTATQLPAKYEDVTSLLAGATLHNGDVIDVSVPDAPTVTGG